MLIGTWNVRAFDRLTPSGGRFRATLPSVTSATAQALLTMLQVLGEGWAFLVTDVTRGRLGNAERLAFVVDRQCVRPSGLACELVVGAEDAGIPEPTLQREFARTPSAVSFASDAGVFTLVTLHVIYGQGAQDRIAELQQIAAWLAEWATGGDVWGANLIGLADFTIDRRDDPLYQAFTAPGCGHRRGSAMFPAPCSMIRIRQPRPIIGTSTIRSPGSLTPPACPP